MADSRRTAASLIPDLLRRLPSGSGLLDVPRRLSALDNAFLAVESDRSPMHVSGLALYRIEGGQGEPIDVVIRAITRVLPGIPALRRRLLPSLPGAPRAYWGRPGTVDLAGHVFSVELPSPGSPRQLLEVAAQLHEHRLDRARPLWQAHVITGLDGTDLDGTGSDGPASGAQPRNTPGKIHFAVVFKVHHAAVDGLTAMTLFAGLHQRRPFDPVGAGKVEPAASGVSAAAVAASRSVLTGARALADEGVDTVVAPVRSTIKVARALAHRREAQADSPALLLPWTALNGSVSARRSLAVVRFDADDVRRVRRLVPGSTANDVVLAAIGGALGPWLRHQAAAASEDGGDRPTEIIAGVPIVRNREAAESPGNAFDLLRIPLGANVADPRERLARIHAATSIGKPGVSGAAGLNDGAEIVPGWLLGLAVQSTSALNRIGVPLPGVHTIVTNVPGPRFALYLERAELTAIHALGPVTNGLAVFHAVTSYRKQVRLTITSSPTVLTDIDDYAERVGAAFQALLTAAE